MGISVEDFMATRSPVRKPRGRRVSAMAPYAKELLELRLRGYTLQDMQAFLQANGVVVTAAGVSMFLTSLTKKGSAQAGAEPRAAAA